MPTRREFLTATAAGVAATLGSRSLARARARATAKFKVGITDWNLDLEGDPRAVALAKELGFDGVQISLSNRNGKDWVGNDVAFPISPATWFTLLCIDGANVLSSTSFAPGP